MTMPSAPHYFQTAVRESMAAYEKRDFPTALKHCKTAAILNPRSAELASTCGAILHEMGQYHEALAWHKTAIALKVTKPEVYSNFGNTLRAMGDLDGALQMNYRALKRDPTNSMTRNNLGCVWTELGDMEKAIHSFDRAISDDPQNYMAFFNRGNAKLLSGNYSTDAWEDYDFRTLAMGMERVQSLPIPWWTGQDLNGKGVYIEIEQGQGDTFQFCRMIYALRDKYPEARITLQVADPLFEVMERNFRGICKVVPGEYRMNTLVYDYRLQLMHLCRVFPEYLSFTPYLKPLAVTKVRNGKLAIGFSWKGNPSHKNDHNRSMHNGEMCELFNTNEAWRSYSLQRGEHFLGMLGIADGTWEETFQLLYALDLIITVDTSIAHVAGALGKPVWLLVPKAPDWRWGLTGSQTRWYPTMKIFRQSLRGDWKHVIENVRNELSECVKSGAPLV